MVGWGGGGHECVWGGVPCTHTCTHMPVEHDNMLNMDASMSAAICNFCT